MTWWIGREGAEPAMSVTAKSVSAGCCFGEERDRQADARRSKEVIQELEQHGDSWLGVFGLSRRASACGPGAEVVAAPQLVALHPDRPCIDL